MLPDSKIFVAGHNGLAGSAIWRELEHQGFTNIFGRRSAELDLAETAAAEAALSHPAAVAISQRVAAIPKESAAPPAPPSIQPGE